MTLDESLTVAMYVDGCLRSTKAAGVKIMTPQNILLGCTTSGFCGTVAFDDLYIWEEAKPAWFIWKLYSE